ncbi:hypothetical protein PsYK624_002120 [Phanerochaete sordida]|uniref:Brain protein I3 n=1 Tax=Phanerochaete sordida TaxID=48140 RepID=A0A9P3FX05_9APHY|nr:hypothetical protein PsYK624_002120 [Phanerochaete sordida]
MYAEKPEQDGTAHPQPFGAEPPTGDSNTDARKLGADYQNELMARCARGDHDPKTNYGTVGILWAVCCFPCGLYCLSKDKQRRCVRCGVRVDQP